MIVNFAERAHNHNWELDPVTRSLLDTDFYKLLMLQFIWKHYPKTHVQFTVFNRSSSGPGRYFRARRTHRATRSRPRTSAFEGPNWSGWPATRFTAAAEFLNPPFWNGWSAISDCRTTNCQSRTATFICPSTACGPTRRCGSFIRFPSSTSCEPAPI